MPALSSNINDFLIQPFQQGFQLLSQTTHRENEGRWSNYETVLRYAHLSGQHLQGAAERVIKKC